MVRSIITRKITKNVSIRYDSSVPKYQTLADSLVSRSAGPIIRHSTKHIGIVYGLSTAFHLIIGSAHPILGPMRTTGSVLKTNVVDTCNDIIDHLKTGRYYFSSNTNNFRLSNRKYCIGLIMHFPKSSPTISAGSIQARLHPQLATGLARIVIEEDNSFYHKLEVNFKPDSLTKPYFKRLYSCDTVTYTCPLGTIKIKP